MEYDQIIRDIQQGLILLGHKRTVGIETFSVPEEKADWVACVPVSDRLDEDRDYGGEGSTPMDALLRMRIAVIEAVRALVAKGEEPAKWLRELKNKPPIDLPPPVRR